MQLEDELSHPLVPPWYPLVVERPEGAEPRRDPGTPGAGGRAITAGVVAVAWASTGMLVATIGVVAVAWASTGMLVATIGVVAVAWASTGVLVATTVVPLATSPLGLATANGCSNLSGLVAGRRYTPPS